MAAALFRGGSEEATELIRKILQGVGIQAEYLVTQLWEKKRIKIRIA